ncbi:MAG: DNA-directed RNA polymerase subunit beta, partial [Desulfovibrio sp.]|nr:DNA-directed RNA polymerase subunit beta [Desulfovibrio sp.]
IIPMRGSWLDFDFDHKDILYVRIDRRRKMPATILFKAMGMSKADILDYFYESEWYRLDSERVLWEVQKHMYRKETPVNDITDADGKVIVEAGKPLTKRHWRIFGEKGIDVVPLARETLEGLFLAKDMVNPETGEVMAEAGAEITTDLLSKLHAAGVDRLPVLHTRGTDVSPSMRDTLMLDKTADMEQAQVEIYRRLRPSSPPTPEIAAAFFENLFRNADYYDLSPVGRYKLNQRLGFPQTRDERTLSDEDILAAIRLLCRLKDSHGPADDIDHLGNRRVRPVGELVENQYRIGLVRMERAIKERMSLQEVATLMPHDLINPKPVAAVLKEFFGTSQLSQFMDQTNPLSEVTHKRRLSALGPGGLTRERAGFEVRDVHVSHYGRICPIETPEGPNIGLIVSLTTYARVNDFGFIETPYRVVKDGKVTDDIHFLDASREYDEVIAQANATLQEDGSFESEMLTTRMKGDVLMSPREEVTLMDISPSQMVSISAALIPFLEHDDANRALMGSNMQRQAVPLLRPEVPLVGTGMEGVVAKDSGSCLLAEGDGVVRYADAQRVIVSYEGDLHKRTGGVKAYELQKYHKSNQNSCFGQRPLVVPGTKVKRGDVLADGPSIQNGELALGKNLLVAFMPWCGYNFEDSILISERVVKEDVYTSVHIEEFEVVARDTKLGPEEVTRDIPNVSEDMLRNLDESGIIRIGANVKADDILVGKITPKGETQLSPEEKLLRAIFGEKAGDVKDTSLRVPPGVGGIIIGAQVFSREGAELDERAKEIQSAESDKLKKDLDDEIKILQDSSAKKIRQLLVDRISSSKVVDDETDKVYLTKGKSITNATLDQMPVSKWSEITVQDGDDIEAELGELFEAMEEQVEFSKMVYDQKINKLKKGDELPPGVIKMVKVYVAIKRKISVGDKVAGRHGNKGVISRILPMEDMPYMEDGRPVEVVLNPLGVPSRMNIGQILEVHLGWAARGLGEKIHRLVEEAQSKENLVALLKKVYGKNPSAAQLEDM